MIWLSVRNEDIVYSSASFFQFFLQHVDIQASELLMRGIYKCCLLLSENEEAVVCCSILQSASHRAYISEHFNNNMAII